MAELCRGRVGALGISQGKVGIHNFRKALAQKSQAEVTESSSILSEVHIRIPLEKNCGVPLKGSSKVPYCGFIWMRKSLKYTESCWFQMVYLPMHHVMHCFLMLHQTHTSESIILLCKMHCKSDTTY